MFYRKLSSCRYNASWMKDMYLYDVSLFFQSKIRDRIFHINFFTVYCQKIMYYSQFLSQYTLEKEALYSSKTSVDRSYVFVKSYNTSILFWLISNTSCISILQTLYFTFHTIHSFYNICNVLDMTLNVLKVCKWQFVV